MKGVFFILMACFLWALDTLIRYPLGKSLSAENIVFFEHLFLTIAFAPLLLSNVKKIFSMKKMNAFYFLIIGGLGSAIGTLAFTKAFTLINPSVVILLQKFQPVVAILFARFLLKEKVKPTFILWAFLAIIGAVLVSFNDTIASFNSMKFSLESFTDNQILGHLLALLAVFSWGISTVLGKKLSSVGHTEFEIMGGRFFTGFLCLLPLTMVGSISYDLSGDMFLKILFMISISGILGMYFYYRGLKQISARLSSLAELFFPFCAVTVNWIFLGSELSLPQILGGLLLLLSSTVIQLKHY